MAEIRQIVAAHSYDKGIALIRSGNLVRTVYTRIRGTYAGAYLAVGLIALSVASIGLASLLIVRSARQARPTGVRRALGASQDAIRLEYIRYGLQIGFGGMVAGGLVGVLIAPWVADLLGYPVLIQWSTVTVTGVVVAATSLLASWLPAAAVARMDPVLAIKDPALLPHLRPVVQSVLAVVGVALAVVSTSVVGSLGWVVQDRLTDYMALVGNNLVVIEPHDLFDERVRSLPRPPLDASVKQLLSAVDGPHSAELSIVAQHGLGSGDRKTTAWVALTDPHFAEVRLFEFAEGRVFSGTARNECVLGSRLAATLFGPSAVGQILRVGESDFEVVGVLKPSPPGVVEEKWERDDTVYLDHTASPLVPYAAGMTYREIAMRFPNEADVPRAVDALRNEVLPSQAGIALFNVSRPFVEAEGLRELRAKQTGAFWVFGALAGLAAVVNLMNYMFVRAAAKQREFGIRRALGATAGEISRSLVFQAMRLCLLGGGIGAVAATVLAATVLRSPTTQIWAAIRGMLLSFALATLLGLLGSLLPAVWAGRLNPVETIRGD